MNASNLFLQIIGAAVTPVVMISACASLILGINAKHTGLADRARAVAAELRSLPPDARRRVSLLLQVQLFQRRFRMTWLSLTVLYAAVAIFTLTTLVILVGRHHLNDSNRPALALFLLGVVLMLLASGLEILETLLASRTLAAELSDVAPGHPPQS